MQAVLCANYDSVLSTLGWLDCETNKKITNHNFLEVRKQFLKHFFFLPYGVETRDKETGMNESIIMHVIINHYVICFAYVVVVSKKNKRTKHKNEIQHRMRIHISKNMFPLNFDQYFWYSFFLLSLITKYK